MSGEWGWIKGQENGMYSEIFQFFDRHNKHDINVSLSMSFKNLTI